METIDKASCPNCGAALPLGRAGGSVRCQYCSTSFSYTATPSNLGTPAVIDELEGMIGVPLHAERKVLLVGWHEDRVTELEACDPDTGRSRWRVQSERSHQPLCCAFERVYFCTGKGELCAVDSASGNVAFVAALPAPVSVVGRRIAVADPLGPGQPRATVLVHCENGQLVAVDRMSGEQVHTWPMKDPPSLWVVQKKMLLLGPVGAKSRPPEIWLLGQPETEPVVVHTLAPGELFGGSIANLAVIQSSTGQHTAYKLTGEQAWQGMAAWKPRTGQGAVFAQDLFVSDGETLNLLPSGKSITVELEALRAVAGTAIATTSDGVIGYTRALKQRWKLSLDQVDWVRLFDNDRMLICATQRNGQLWLRGVLPPNGRTRWSVLIPESGEFEGLELADDLVLVLAGGRRFVVRADNGQIVWTTSA